MTRWKQGEAEIEHMLDDGQLDRVPADDRAVTMLVGAAARHVASATSLVDSDPEAAYSLAYDAGRKAATAVLAHQGLRPTARGGHLAVVRAMREQFPNAPGLTSLDMLRRRRNQAEYPDPKGYDALTSDEVEEAIAVARDVLGSTERLLDLPEVGVF